MSTSVKRDDEPQLATLVFLSQGQRLSGIMVNQTTVDFSRRERAALRELAFAPDLFVTDEEFLGDVVRDLEALYRVMSRLRKKVGKDHLVRGHCPMTGETGYGLILTRVVSIDVSTLPRSVTDIVSVVYEICRNRPDEGAA